MQRKALLGAQLAMIAIVACRPTGGTWSAAQASAPPVAASDAPGTGGPSDVSSGGVTSHRAAPTGPGAVAGTPIPMERTMPGSSSSSLPAGGGEVSPGQPAYVPGSPGRGAQRPIGDAPASDPATWPIYRSDVYGFELRYPPELAIVPAGDEQPPAAPFALLLRVSLQDRRIAASPLALMQPPQFAAEVFDNAGGRSLESWLAEDGQPATVGRFDIEPARIGGVDGLRVTDRAQLAPNTFYYFSVRQFVYRFTPLGPGSDMILASVTFTP